MKHFLSVTTQASSFALLSIEEMRSLAGVTDSSRDVELSALGLRIAAAIAAECNIAIGSGGNPTLLRETLTETFYNVDSSELFLARRHEISIASIVEDTVTLDAAEYVADPESGAVTRLSDDVPVSWCASKIVIVYDAGFAAVPGDLKYAAMDFFRATISESGRDPMVKRLREDIPGVMARETDYWVGAVPGQSNDGPVPSVVSEQLKRFRNGWEG